MGDCELDTQQRKDLFHHSDTFFISLCDTITGCTYIVFLLSTGSILSTHIVIRFLCLSCDVRVFGYGQRKHLNQAFSRQPDPEKRKCFPAGKARDNANLNSV